MYSLNTLEMYYISYNNIKLSKNASSAPNKHIEIIHQMIKFLMHVLEITGIHHISNAFKCSFKLEKYSTLLLFGTYLIK